MHCFDHHECDLRKKFENYSMQYSFTVVELPVENFMEEINLVVREKIEFEIQIISLNLALFEFFDNQNSDSEKTKEISNEYFSTYLKICSETLKEWAQLVVMKMHRCKCRWKTIRKPLLVEVPPSDFWNKESRKTTAEKLLSKRVSWLVRTLVN